jgi:hypothetical protein
LRAGPNGYSGGGSGTGSTGFSAAAFSRRSTVVSDSDDAFADDADGPAFAVNYITQGRATRILDPAKGTALTTPRGAGGGGGLSARSRPGVGDPFATGLLEEDEEEAAGSDDDDGNDDGTDGGGSGGSSGGGDGRPRLLGPLPGTQPAAAARHRMSLRTFDSEAAQRLQPSQRHGRASVAFPFHPAGATVREEEGAEDEEDVSGRK